MKKVALHNLGCKVNSYELEVMQQNLEQNGYKIVPFDHKADIYIVNTCSVTNIADRKSRQMLHRAKTENPEAIVIAVGCYVQTRPADEILEDGVDILVGNNKKNDIVEIINGYFENQEDGEITASNTQNVIDINSEKFYEDMTLKGTKEHTRAYIKVQDGCNQFCSYCIIPYARGRSRSRGIKDILAEIDGLTKEGFKEFVLTGIHLSSYEDGEAGLIELIEAVAKLDGVKRIRLGSLEPRIITEEFTKRLSVVSEICPHFHLSLQSGCAATLARMNRHYTPEEYKTGVEILRKYFNKPAITTDIIVGFPGEDEKEFEECVEFARDVKFYETHIFKYSKRKGTRAALMEGQLIEKEKTNRSKVLLELNLQNKKSYILDMENEESEMLVEEHVLIDGTDYQVGYTKEYIRAAVISQEDLTGKIVRGKIKMSQVVESGQQICIFSDIGVQFE